MKKQILGLLLVAGSINAYAEPLADLDNLPNSCATQLFISSLSDEKLLGNAVNNLDLENPYSKEIGACLLEYKDDGTQAILSVRTNGIEFFAKSIRHPLATSGSILSHYSAEEVYKDMQEEKEAMKTFNEQKIELIGIGIKKIKEALLKCHCSEIE